MMSLLEPWCGDDVTLLLFNSFVAILTTTESSGRLWVGNPAASH